MIELDVRRWQPHTLEATETTPSEWCMFVRPLGGGTLGDRRLWGNWIKGLASFASLAVCPVAAAARTGNLDSNDVLVITLVVIAVTVLPAVAICWQFWNSSMKVKVQSGVNDDDAAAKTFIEILDRAQTTLDIYDDGNKMERTIYDDPTVTKAMLERLDANKDLVVRCLFNDKADLCLVRTMRAEHPDRFKVWYRCGSRPPGDDVHYKIADKGAVIHISLHEHGQPERKFKLLDCTSANRITKKIALGGHLTQFEKNIKEHAVAGKLVSLSGLMTLGAKLLEHRV